MQCFTFVCEPKIKIFCRYLAEMFYLRRLYFNFFIYLFIFQTLLLWHHLTIKNTTNSPLFSFTEPSVLDFSLLAVLLICLLYLALSNLSCFWSEECEFIFAVHIYNCTCRPKHYYYYYWHVMQ